MNDCDRMDYSLPGSSVHGVLQARILEWVAMPSSRGSSWPWIEPVSLASPAWTRGFFTTSPTWKPMLSHAMLQCCAKSVQSCLTLCNPMDCSLPCSSVHWILQARILEWVAMPSSRESSQPRDWTQVSCDSRIVAGFFTSEPSRP